MRFQEKAKIAALFLALALQIGCGAVAGPPSWTGYRLIDREESEPRNENVTLLISANLSLDRAAEFPILADTYASGDRIHSWRSCRKRYVTRCVYSWGRDLGEFFILPFSMIGFTLRTVTFDFDDFGSDLGRMGAMVVPGLNAECNPKHQAYRNYEVAQECQSVERSAPFLEPVADLDLAFVNGHISINTHTDSSGRVALSAAECRSLTVNGGGEIRVLAEHDGEPVDRLILRVTKQEVHELALRGAP